MTFVVILHVFVSIFMILVVLLQPGNKGGMGAAFGGAGGSTAFGGRGANTFLAKLTAAAAFVFMCTSFGLVYFSSQGQSAFDKVPGAAPAGDEEGEGDAAAEGEGTPGDNAEGAAEGDNAEAANSGEAPADEATGDAAPSGDAAPAGDAAAAGDAAPAGDPPPAP